MYAYFKLSHRALKFFGLTVAIIVGLFFEQKIVTVIASVPEPLDQIKTTEKAMALTINVDWGEEYLPGILEILDQKKAKATFFLTGRWAKKNPDIVKAIVSRGHEIGNHGYSHPHPDRISIAANEEEIKKTENIVQGITGIKMKYYAPPYGERGTPGLRAAQNLGYRTILWTLDTVDWRPESTPDVIAKRILNPAIRFGIKPTKEGAIILMHPKENTLRALPTILEQLTRDGFKLVTLTELITLDGVGNTTS